MFCRAKFRVQGSKFKVAYRWALGLRLITAYFCSLLENAWYKQEIRNYKRKHVVTTFLLSASLTKTRFLGSDIGKRVALEVICRQRSIASHLLRPIFFDIVRLTAHRGRAETRFKVRSLDPRSSIFTFLQLPDAWIVQRVATPQIWKGEYG